MTNKQVENFQHSYLYIMNILYVDLKKKKNCEKSIMIRYCHKKFLFQMPKKVGDSVSGELFKSIKNYNTHPSRDYSSILVCCFQIFILVCSVPLSYTIFKKIDLWSILDYFVNTWFSVHVQSTIFFVRKQETLHYHFMWHPLCCLYLLL